MPTDDSLEAIVRAVLPKPPSVKEWQVDVVDTFDEVGADDQTETVRIHKTWRETVYDPGLFHVTRHYPLAVETVDQGVWPISLLEKPLNLWRAVAIEREYFAGFTGGLSVSEVFVAQSFDTLGRFADRDPIIAGRAALRQRGSRRAEERAQRKRLTSLRKNIRDSVLARPRRFRPTHIVSLGPFRPYLPAYMIKCLELHDRFGSVDLVPLADLEMKCAEAMMEIPEGHIAYLMYALDLAVQQACKPIHAEGIRLTSEEDAVLAEMAKPHS